MNLTLEQWQQYVAAMPGRLASIDRSTDDGGLRAAIVEVWQTISAAPSTVIHRYTRIPELEITVGAAAVVPRSRSTSFGLPPTDPDPARMLLQLAVALRALEIELTVTFDMGERPFDPNSDWLVPHPLGDVFLIPLPRRAWKADAKPAEDFRPFDQRGLLSLSIVPARVDGADVHITYPDVLPRKVRDLPFGAVLFRDIEFEEEKRDGTFVVTKVTGTGMTDDLLTGLKAAHREACVALIFPELTIDDDLLSEVREGLVDKPWAREGDAAALTPPALVVAGSWHRSVPGGFANVAIVLDGHGNVLVEHWKRYAARDSGRSEDIVSGSVFEILVMPDGLFAFGICLDFCQGYFKNPYGPLNVDFVLVPSCGNDVTMAGHIHSAETLHIQRRTRSFVVQQAYPRVSTEIGYVLPPDGKIGDKTAENLKKSVSWSVFRADEFV